ncbi:MAG: hypothetical protein RL211_2301 [Pseudomonadota bacterium]|jgi:hypothetical protein
MGTQNQQSVSTGEYRDCEYNDAEGWAYGFAQGVQLRYARPMMEAVAINSSRSANETLPDTA